MIKNNNSGAIIDADLVGAHRESIIENEGEDVNMQIEKENIVDILPVGESGVNSDIVKDDVALQEDFNLGLGKEQYAGVKSKDVNEVISDGEKVNASNNSAVVAEIQPKKHIELDPYIPLDLESVWFVKVLDKNGDIQIHPCMFGFGEQCKSDEQVLKTFIDFSTGDVYDSAEHEPFSALGNFVSAHRWEKLDIETMIVKESMFDGDSDEAIKYSSTRDDMGNVKRQHQYVIDISCVVSGNTGKPIKADTAKKSLASLQKENYKKYLGNAIHNIYNLEFNSETNVEKVVQYAKDYTTRYKQMHITKMKNVTQAKEGENAINALEKREVNPFTRVNFDNIWFVTHKNEEGKLIVSPCAPFVLDSGQKAFVDYSTGYVYKATRYVPFAMMEGYVGAYRWQQIELMTLNILEREVSKDIQADKWLNAPLLGGHEIERPWNEYAISITGVVTEKNKQMAFFVDSPFDRKFRDFRVKNYKDRLEKASVNIFKFDDHNEMKVKDVCEYAKAFAERLNPEVKEVVPHISTEELEKQIKKDNKIQKKQNRKAEKSRKEKDGDEGLFASIIGFFTNRKYKKNKREIEDALGKE